VESPDDVSDWLQILESTGEIFVVPPYFENLGNRLIKSAKVYWGDSGLACYLLGIPSASEPERSPFLGSLFEGFVASEILKSRTNRGWRRELYGFRDQQGLEVDFLSPRGNAGVWLTEVKAEKLFKSGWPIHRFAYSELSENSRDGCSSPIENLWDPL